jgi:predicted nucleotidyltransferase
MPEKLDFITPTILKILYLFHEDPMQEVHEREIVRRAKVSKGSANKILRKLTEIKVLERNEKGRMVFYRLNTMNAVARQFKVLFNVYSLNKLVERIKQDCKAVILFGSCSDGTDSKGSDVDLFILTNEKDKVTSRVSIYQNNIGKRIAPVIVNANELVRLKKEDKPLHERIFKGTVLWESE